jgi:RNA polymerase sigma-70 factor (ECF subfamily)
MSYYADGAEESIVDSVADSPQRQPENELDARRQAKQLQKLIEALPEAQREAFLLSEEGDLSLKEIAHIMGVNAETAKSRLRYAIAKLRAGMKSGSTQKAE